MSPRRDERRLATVLFIDIVESTRIAADMGDARWRQLLAEFRRIVRGTLKRHGGREEDTAGDGFFSTFERPVSAVRCAAEVAEEVQKLGVDVRCGLHSGELERIDGRWGGIAAHVGARVVAKADATDVLTTATVRDLVMGSGVVFEPRAETRLRGLAGRFRLYRVVTVAGRPLPAPLTPEEAAERLGAAPPSKRRGPWAPAATAVALLIVVGAVVALALGAGADEVAGPSLTPSDSVGHRLTLIGVDPDTNAAARLVHDRHVAVGRSPLFVIDGTLWQETPIALVRRDLETGEALDVLALPDTWGVWFGFGSLWMGRISYQGGDLIDRVDPLSGRTIASIETEAGIIDVAPGDGQMWLLTSLGDLLELDPRTNEIVDRDPLPTEETAGAITVIGDSLWVCECGEGRLTEFDPAADTVVRTVTFAQRGFPLPQRIGSQGVVETDAGTMWLLDPGGGTVTPIDAVSGEAGQPLGIPRPVAQHAIGFESIWLAAAGRLHRIDIASGESTALALPTDMAVAGVALDEEAGVVWAATCVPSIAASRSEPDPCQPP